MGEVLAKADNGHVTGTEPSARGSAREPVSGDLLVSAPSLLDPNFRRTIVLLVQVEQDGAVGLVLNRPASLEAGELPFPSWLLSRARIRQGGPVGSDSVLAIGDSDQVPECSSRPLFVGLCAVDLDSLEEQSPLAADISLFVGYAGWGPGQLLNELQSDDWAVVAGSAADALRVPPEHVWWEVVGRQRSPVRLWRTLAEDPRSN